MALPYLSFRQTDIFDSDGKQVRSEATLRFPHPGEVEQTVASGFAVLNVRGAPDRPGRENVVVAGGAAEAGAASRVGRPGIRYPAGHAGMGSGRVTSP